MYLSGIYIENFRSIEKLDLKFEKGKNIIVGKNNSGKSNILKAIDLVLGEFTPDYKKTNNIDENDFYTFKNDKDEICKSNEIFIFCELKKIDDEVINYDEFKSLVFYRLYEDKDFNYPLPAIEIIRFDDIKKQELFYFTTETGQQDIDNKYKKKWIGGKNYCKCSIEKEFKDKTNFAFAFRAFINEDKIIEKQLVFLYREHEEENWIIALNANGIRNLILQSAIIPSFRDPKEQLRITSYSWFGKLLKNYINNEHKTAIKTETDKAIQIYNNVFYDLKSQLNDKDSNIAFPETEISFQFNAKEEDIHKNVFIYVDDGFNSLLQEKGAGIQSAVIIGLYNYYIKNILHKGCSLLAVEEPELYLHPHAKRVISDQLSNFIGSDENQVIITTHAPEFLCNPSENQNIIVVRKENNKTTAKNIIFNDIKKKQILIKKQNAEMFFADFVILSEGADKYILEETAKLYGANNILGQCWLNDKNISIIDCGGKTYLCKYAEILKSLNIPFITTADFDFLGDGLSEYFTFLSINPSSLNTLKSQINLKIKKLADISDTSHKSQVESFLKTLDNIIIFSGELEDFYIERSKWSKKEAGVLEILNAVIQGQYIENIINIEEYNQLFDLVKQRVCNNSDI